MNYSLKGNLQRFGYWNGQSHRHIIMRVSIYTITQPPVFGFSSVTNSKNWISERQEWGKSGLWIYKSCETVNIVRSHHAPSFPLQSIKDEAFKHSWRQAGLMTMLATEMNIHLTSPVYLRIQTSAKLWILLWWVFEAARKATN